MTTVTIDLKELPARLKSLLKRAGKDIGKALQDGAKRGSRIVSRNAPIAFKELADGVYAEMGQASSRIVVSAPHAQPVEVGSRPHWAPLAPLIEWVKLRGMQGLGDRGGTRRFPKDISTPKGFARAQAHFVARELKKLVQNGTSPVDAPEQIARAIQAAIAKGGTKPTFFVRKSLPAIGEATSDSLKTRLDATFNEG